MAFGPRSKWPVEFVVNFGKLISYRLLQILLLLLYFPFPGLFRSKLTSSGAICSLHSPPKGRIFPLLLLLLALLLLLLLLLLVVVLPVLLLLLLLLILLVMLVLLLLLVLLVLLLHTRQNHLLSNPSLRLLHLFLMREIPRNYRSSCCLIVLKDTWHIEDQLPPSPRRLLNTDAKLLRIEPMQYLVLINPKAKKSYSLERERGAETRESLI